jgi:tetratricopeptide (TPR) repeat protein
VANAPSALNVLLQGQSKEKKDAVAASKSGDKSEDINQLLILETLCQAMYDQSLEKKGAEHEDTLNAALKLIDQWIGFYFLTKADDLLTTIFPVCEKKGGSFHARVVQSLAFVRFKQYRFAESLELMLLQRKLLGNCVELCENIGHVYNSLGMRDNAEKEFRDGLVFLENDSTASAARTGGLLLGLAQILQSKQKYDAAIQHFHDAKTAYLKVHSTEHSLIAKTTMYIGNVHEKKGELKEAETQYRECIRIFIVTCGENTPLTASAWKHLADVLLKQGQVAESDKLMKDALSYEVTFNPLRLFPVFEMLTSCLRIQTSRDSLEEKRSKALVPIAEAAVKAAAEQKLKRDGNLAVLYKTAAEILLLGNAPQMVPDLLRDAIEMLASVKEMNVNHLVQECQQLLMITSQVPKT